MAGQMVTISANGTVSSAIDLQQTSLVGIHVPTNFNGNTLTIQTSLDGNTYYNVETGAGAVLTLTVNTAPCYLVVDPMDLVGVRLMKLTAGSAQTADMDLVLAARNV